MSIDLRVMQIEQSMCEQSHLFFTRRFFVPRMGFKFLRNWHHALICDKLDAVMRGEIKNIVFCVPPGSGKTELCGGNLVAHGLARNSRCRFLYLSFSNDLVVDVLATARNIVSSSEFQSMWPVELASDSSAKANWRTMENGFYAGHAYGAALGGQITGRRAGVLGIEGFTGAIVVDDPLKPEDAFSDPMRKKTVRKLINTVTSRKAHPDVPVIMIMQRLHVDDPVGAVVKRVFPGDWEVVTIPALIDDDYIDGLDPRYQALIDRDVPRDSKGRMSYWPAKESLDYLNQLEKGGEDKDGAAVSRYTFGSQYMQEPVPLGGDLIKTEHFGRYQHLPPLQYRMIWADTAQKTEEHNDYSAFLHGGVGYDGYLYLTDLVRGKWEAPALETQATAFIGKHKPVWTNSGVLRGMRVEDKVSGTGLIQSIGRTSKVPIMPIQRNTNKLMRFMDVQGYLQVGRVFIPTDAPWISDFLTECEAFKADMTHDFDDQVDVLIDAITDIYVTPPPDPTDTQALPDRHQSDDFEDDDDQWRDN